MLKKGSKIREPSKAMKKYPALDIIGQIEDKERRRIKESKEVKKEEEKKPEVIKAKKITPNVIQKFD